MSAKDDVLRRMAANRGCRLVKSRVRTPGRRDHGRYGLEDADTGASVFGMGKRGLKATGEEIEAFLREADAKRWHASLKPSRSRR